MQQWEYKVMDYAERMVVESISYADKLGEQGWELVNVVCGKDGKFYAFYKRLKT